VSASPPPPHPGLRALAWFWGATATLLLGGGLTLQLLGPPAPSGPGRGAGKPVAAHAAVPKTGASRTGVSASAPDAQGADPAGAGMADATLPPDSVVARPDATPGAIPPPDPALLEPASAFPDGALPRISAFGITPMRAYARPAPPPDGKPRIAILIGGIGLAERDTDEAIRLLPGPVDLAFSAYAVDTGPALEAARRAGHEFLISIPMEPAGFPRTDAGFRSLLTGAGPGLNRRNLDWALSRIAGYIGATGASDGLRGERFAANAPEFDEVARTLAARGLLYIDPRPGAGLPTLLAGRAVDLVLDEPPDAIDAKLDALEQAARRGGAALGLAGPPRPAVVRRIAAWARTLPARGIELVPASALILPPRTGDGPGDGNG